MIHVGQVNAIIRVAIKSKGLPLDISNATIKTIKLRNPAGRVQAYAASFLNTGTDGVIQYATTTPDVLDQAGPWMGQPYIEQGEDKFHGAPFSFQVGEALDL